MSTSSLQDYILGRVTKDVDTGCWLWNLARDGGGYGICTVKGKTARPHRVSYEAFEGPIPVGFMVCHTCDVRHCCNPDHLFLGTAKDNTQDMIDKGRAPDPHRETKLTDEQVRQIRARLLIKTPQHVLAEEYGVARTTISAISTGRSWRSE